MTESHDSKFFKVQEIPDVKRAMFQTNFKVTDHIKDKIACKKTFDTVEILEMDDNFFFFKTLETINKLTFECYTIGDSPEIERHLYCTRGFKQNSNTFRHVIREPIISITEKSLGKRNMEDHDSMFSINQKKPRILCKSGCGVMKDTVESFVKIVKNRTVL